MLVNSENNQLVSVVIPVHNGERYISSTIESVLLQSYSNFELIIVNDGSVDLTDKIISEYLTKDNRIRCIQQVKAGVSAARNTGINASKGKYISFLDADDIWSKENLGLKINFLQSNKQAFGVTSFCEIIDENNHNSGMIKTGDKRISLKDVLSWKGNYITIPSGIVFQTDILKNNGCFNTDLSNNADQEIIMRLLNTGYSFHTLQFTTWFYRIHGNNMSSNIELMESDTIKCYQLAIENKYFKSFIFKNKCMSRMSLILAFSFWRNANNKTKAMKWMLNSFRFSPAIFVEQIIERLLYINQFKLKK